MKSTKRTIFIAPKCAARRWILIAGMGTSPAVLTETVWALAHQKKLVVPDEIVVLTTKPGKEALRTAVMSGASGVWERLKAALRKEKDRVTAKYSLEGVSTPIGIADYALEKFLPADFASDLPDVEAIESDQTRRLQQLLEKHGMTDDGGGR